MFGTDAVETAIEKGKHNTKLASQEWTDFFNVISGKKIILYGIGDGVPILLLNHPEIEIDCAVDNNKAGRLLSDYDYSLNEASRLNFKVEKREALLRYNPSETVVLITALNRYEEIYDLVTDVGYRFCFSFLCMEANERKKVKDRTVFKSPILSYIDYCKTLPIEESVLVQTISPFSGHGRAVADVLLRKRPDMKAYWVVERNNNVEDSGINDANVVFMNSSGFYKAISTSRLWLLEDPIDEIINKRDGQYCVQLKHWAGVTLKKFGYEAEKDWFISHNKEELSKHILFPKEYWIHNAENTDCVVVGSNFDEQTMREGYLYNGAFLYAGSPRSDILFNYSDCQNLIKKQFGLDENVKIAIYAPTFRFDKKRSGNYKETNLDYASLKKALADRFGGQWIIMLRLHPRTNEASIPIFPDYIVNASKYYDSEILISACDVLVTDYSSIMFEPAFVKKPVFLYAPDMEEYVKNERGFLISYDDLPFSVSTTNEELARNIAEYNDIEYTKIIEAFLNKYGVCEDGHASERAADYILNQLDGLIKGIG